MAFWLTNNDDDDDVANEEANDDDHHAACCCQTATAQCQCDQSGQLNQSGQLVSSSISHLAGLKSMLAELS